MNQPLGEDWDWDKNKKDMNIRLITIIKSFKHLISFFYALQLVEPMLPLVTISYVKLIEVFFGLKTIEWIIHVYEEIREKVVNLVNKFGTKEK